MNLYNRKTLISVAPEGQAAPSKKASITQWIYFAIVILAVAYVIYLLLKPYFVVEANGLVDVDIKTLAAERSGRVQHWFVSADQPFKQGDLLARLAPEKHCPAADNSQLDKLGYDIDLLRNDIRALQQQKRQLAAQQAPQNAMLRALEVNASLFTEQQKAEASLQKSLQQLDADIQRQQGKLGIMLAREQQVQRAQQQQPQSPDCLAKDVIAHEDGQVAEIRVLSNGYAEKGQSLLKYTPTNAQARVLFLADAKLYDAFAEQPKWLVTFPNGIQSLASVARIESVASGGENNLDALLALQSVSLKMILVPADPAHNALWQQFDRLPVSVRGVR